MKTFAIAVPNYNQSRFLPDALESLRHQTAAFELAVMDGGSRDNFQAAVSPYNRIITHLRCAPDNGQAGAIRDGLNEICGDVVAWLNADDYYFPDALQRVAEVFEARPEVDVVYGDAVHVNARGMFLSYFLPVREFDASHLGRNLFICQPACFVRRRAYEGVGGLNPGLHYVMDWELWCRLAADGAQFAYLRQPLAAVRVHPQTKTSSGSRRRYREIFSIERRYGRRVLPKSWIGAYWHQLYQQALRSPLETMMLGCLHRLRHLKNRLVAPGAHPTAYGFHPWRDQVVGTAVLHLPWYRTRQWTGLNLRVEPGDGPYAVRINQGRRAIFEAQTGRLRVPVAAPLGSQRRISVACVKQKQWRLLEFDCDFEVIP